MILRDKIENVANTLMHADLTFGQGSGDAWDEAAWMVLYSIGVDPIDDEGNDNSDRQRALTRSEIKNIDIIVSKRINSKIPFAFLVNEIWFAGNKFYIDERVIIPRSYLSEWIPDAFAPWVESDSVDSILDLCTGCGCIAISCALAFPDANVIASDISAQALEVACINIENYNLGERVNLNRGDCFTGIDQKFDLILCNPPYVSDERMDSLPLEYRNEPELALRAGENGLEFIVPMLREVEKYLENNGTLIVEAGSASGALEELYPAIPFTWLSTAYDETVVFAMNASEVRKYSKFFNSV